MYQEKNHYSFGSRLGVYMNAYLHLTLCYDSGVKDHSFQRRDIYKGLMHLFIISIEYILASNLKITSKFQMN